VCEGDGVEVADGVKLVTSSQGSVCLYGYIKF